MNTNTALARDNNPHSTRLAARWRRFWARLVETLGRFWTWMRDLGAVLYLCRFSLLMLIAGVAFLHMAQGQDILRPLAEASVSKLAWFFGAVVMWAMSSWYWARVMLRLPFILPKDLSEQQQRNRKVIRIFLPRMLGLIAFVGVGVAFGEAAKSFGIPATTKSPYEAAWNWIEGLVPVVFVIALTCFCYNISQRIEHAAGQNASSGNAPIRKSTSFWVFVAAAVAQLWILAAPILADKPTIQLKWLAFYALSCYAMGVLFCGYTVKRNEYRKYLFSKLFKNTERPSIKGEGKFQHFYYLLKRSLTESPPETYISPGQFSQQILTWSALLAYLALSLVLFILFISDPTWAAKIGAGTIVLLAALVWIPWGSALVAAFETKKVPFISILIILVASFSYCNDNHEIRTLSAAANQKRPELANHFSTWLESGLAGWTRSEPYPVFIVAAEGGGVRAAYWAAMVLATLQDRNPEFSDHVYAISGVSGGSLGAAVFSGLVKAQNEAAARAGSEAIGKLQPLAHSILSKDFLAPTVAYLLYPDLLNRFLFWPIDSFDRSRALEGAWEQGWSDVMHTDQLGAGFHELWEPAGINRVPSLFLNSTWVETGKRVIASNILIDDSSSNPDRTVFSDAVDFFGRIGTEVPLSTAVHNSARFMVVSPAGTLRPRDSDGNRSDVWGHLVDGGYFENSGATTAYEILREMQRNLAPADRKRIRPVVLMMINNPKLDDQKTPKPARFITETRSPIATLLNTRNARGSYAREALRDMVLHGFQSSQDSEQDRASRELGAEGIYFPIRLQNDGCPYPLGWTLSDFSMEKMQRQLAERLEKLHDPLDLESLQIIAKKASAQSVDANAPKQDKRCSE